VGIPKSMTVTKGFAKYFKGAPIKCMSSPTIELTTSPAKKQSKVFQKELAISTPLSIQYSIARL
jgi:hypothetical protein